MRRLPQPDPVSDEAHARAYAEADFAERDRRFLEYFDERFSGRALDGYVLDLGCGPGAVTLAFAAAHAECMIHGVDASEGMLHQAEQLLARHPELAGCVEFLPGQVPDLGLPQSHYQAIISNSLLHRLDDPALFWRAVREHGAPGAPVLVMDLVRPDTEVEARKMVRAHFGTEPELFRRYMLGCLMAAFDPDEVATQLRDAGLATLRVERCDAIHLLVSGRLPDR